MSSADTYFTHFMFVIRSFNCIMLYFYTNICQRLYFHLICMLLQWLFTANRNDHLHWLWSKSLLHWIKCQYSFCLILPNAVVCFIWLYYCTGCLSTHYFSSYTKNHKLSLTHFSIAEYEQESLEIMKTLKIMQRIWKNIFYWHTA